MRSLTLAAIATALVAAGCALTPRQQCEAPYRAELHNVEAEILATEIILRRGFRLIPALWDHGVHYCVSRTGFVSLCTAEDGEPMYDKRPINRRAEQAKLDALHQERARLTEAIAQCAVQFPGG